MAREIKRTILANPDEPRTGDFAYELYNKSRPILGTQSVINRLKEGLRGLRGKEVVMTVKGHRTDDDDQDHRFVMKRKLVINRYQDVFGPGSAYLDAIKAQRDAHSSDALYVESISFDEA